MIYSSPFLVVLCVMRDEFFVVLLNTRVEVKMFAHFYPTPQYPTAADDVCDNASLDFQAN